MPLSRSALGPHFIPHVRSLWNGTLGDAHSHEVAPTNIDMCAQISTLHLVHGEHR